MFWSGWREFTRDTPRHRQRPSAPADVKFLLKIRASHLGGFWWTNPMVVKMVVRPIVKLSEEAGSSRRPVHGVAANPFLYRCLRVWIKPSDRHDLRLSHLLDRIVISSTDPGHRWLRLRPGFASQGMRAILPEWPASASCTSAGGRA